MDSAHVSESMRKNSIELVVITKHLNLRLEQLAELASPFGSQNNTSTQYLFGSQNNISTISVSEI